MKRKKKEKENEKSKDNKVNDYFNNILFVRKQLR